jgi:hypothetical protein
MVMSFDRLHAAYAASQNRNVINQEIEQFSQLSSSVALETELHDAHAQSFRSAR